MSRVRTFIAVPATAEIRRAAEELSKTLSTSTGGVRWVSPENMHLTIKFLGDVEDRELHEVCRVANQVASGAQPFSLSCNSVGAFPSAKKPRTLWLGVSDPEHQLGNVQKNAEVQLAESGFPIERRPFRGHFTLGRIPSGEKGNRKLTEMIEKLSDREFGILPVRELVVYSSELSRHGPTYTTLARCPLRGG